MLKTDYPALRLTYDTSLNPLSFDLVFCLAISRALCDIKKLPDKFDLLLVNKSYRDVGIEGAYSQEYRERKFNDVIISTALLCKWVNSLHIVRGETPVPPYPGPTIPTADSLRLVGKVPQWQITPMVPKQLESLFEQGARIPDYGFRASGQILDRYRARLKGAVVIHPRVSVHSLARNSDKAKIQEVVRALRKDGINIFFVPDIEDLRAGFTWRDLDAEPLLEASLDMETRLAVAEVAATNLLSPGGGNVAMLHFSPASFLCTGFFDESVLLTSTATYATKGPSFGTNPHWLKADTQIYDWTPRSALSADQVHKRLLELIKRDA